MNWRHELQKIQALPLEQLKTGLEQMFSQYFNFVFQFGEAPEFWKGVGKCMCDVGMTSKTLWLNSENFIEISIQNAIVSVEIYVNKYLNAGTITVSL